MISYIGEPEKKYKYIWKKNKIYFRTVFKTNKKRSKVTKFEKYIGFFRLPKQYSPIVNSYIFFFVANYLFFTYYFKEKEGIFLKNTFWR